MSARVPIIEDNPANLELINVCARGLRLPAAGCQDQDLIHLHISDNGVGFPQGAEEREDSIGLPGMRERAHLLGGEVKVVSERNRGTSIVACIPEAS